MRFSYQVSNDEGEWVDCDETVLTDSLLLISPGAGSATMLHLEIQDKVRKEGMITVSVEGDGVSRKFRVRDEDRLPGDTVCKECGGKNVVWFADSPLWNEVMDPTNERHITLCPPCFMRRADSMTPRVNVWRVSKEPTP